MTTIVVSKQFCPVSMVRLKTGGISEFFVTVSFLHLFLACATLRALVAYAQFSLSLAEHALDVAVISHCLAAIANVLFHRNLDADRAALIEYVSRCLQSYLETCLPL